MKLAEQWISDLEQRRIYLDHATQFKQWANYIGALILTRQGQDTFTRKDIVEVLKQIMPHHFDREGAKETGLLTADMERMSKYNLGFPFLEKVMSTRSYRFIGFPTSPTSKNGR